MFRRVTLLWILILTIALAGCTTDQRRRVESYLLTRAASGMQTSAVQFPTLIISQGQTRLPQGLTQAAGALTPARPSTGYQIHAEDVMIEERLDLVLPRGDVLIDFTAPEASLRHAELAVQLGKAVVLGTTGLDAAQQAQLEKAARRIPIVFAPNMSVGVNLLFKVLADVAGVLGDSFDVEIVEAHHRFKKDAPSGTAMGIADAILKATPEAVKRSLAEHLAENVKSASCCVIATVGCPCLPGLAASRRWRAMRSRTEPKALTPRWSRDS